MELILRLKDESKLDALLTTLHRFIKTEGVDLSVEPLQLTEANEANFNWVKWDEIMSRDKLRPGQPEMTEEEEIEFINQAVKETRAARRV